MIREATERGDSSERIVEVLDGHKRRAVADARECEDVVCAAQRLKEVTDAQAAAFNASPIDVVEARCREVEAEYDAVITAKLAEVQPLRNEKTGKVGGLLSLVDTGEICTPDKGDCLFGKGTRKLKEWKGRCAVLLSSPARLMRSHSTGCSRRSRASQTSPSSESRLTGTSLAGSTAAL